MNEFEQIEPLLRAGSEATLLSACRVQPMLCRKYLTLEKLIAVTCCDRWSARGDLAEDQVWRNLREEIVFRLLIQADRARHRDQFLSLLQTPLFDDAALRTFVQELYFPRDLQNFAVSETRYLRGLRLVYRQRQALETGVGQALAWLGAIPRASRRPVRVLFANAELAARYPRSLLAGRCLSFSFKSKSGTRAFGPDDLGRFSPSFTSAAEHAEVDACEIQEEGQYGSRKHVQLTIESPDNDALQLEGSSGYLAFLMAHLCRKRGYDMSPYVGLTGSRPENGLLGPVDHLPHKLAAARDAGLFLVFVPQQAFAGMSCGQQREFMDASGLRVIPFDHQKDIRDVARELLAELTARRDEIVLNLDEAEEPSAANVPFQTTTEPPPTITATTNGSTVIATAPREIFMPTRLSPFMATVADLPTPVSHQPVKLLEDFVPRYGMTGINCFRELGSYGRINSPARLVAFNSDEDRVLIAFPEALRLYVFHPDDGLLDKCRVDDQPTAIGWCGVTSQFLIALRNGAVHRCTQRLESRGVFRFQPGFVPKQLLCVAETIYATDGDRTLAQVAPNQAPAYQSFPERILQISYSEAHDRILIVLPQWIVAYDRQGRPDWQVHYGAASAVLACAGNGELWLADTSGRICRLAASDRRVLNEFAAPFPVQSLVVLDRLVVVGSSRGELALFDLHGRELGRDELKTELCQLCVGAADRLVAGTGQGITVLTPNPIRAAQVTDTTSVDRSLNTLRNWEQELQSGNAISDAIKRFLQNVDLNDWKEVVAFQHAFLQRENIHPQWTYRIRELMDRHDARKGACLCRKTRPVFVDGSNISRFHWNGSKDPQRKGKLAAILRMNSRLASEKHPVLFPIITVIDENERRYSDDRNELTRLIAEGVILETPSHREADALILNYVRQYNWMDCEIVSNDKRMLDAHAEMLPDADRDWYTRVRRSFALNPKTLEITFVPRSYR